MRTKTYFSKQLYNFLFSFYDFLSMMNYSTKRSFALLHFYLDLASDYITQLIFGAFSSNRVRPHHKFVQTPFSIPPFPASLPFLFSSCAAQVGPNLVDTF